MKWKGLLASLAVSSAIASCGPGTYPPPPVEIIHPEPTITPSEFTSIIRTLTISNTYSAHPDLTLVFQPPVQTIEQPLCDDLGHCWKWGAWRNPDDTLWVEDTPYYYSAPAPQYNQPLVAATGGSISSYEECLVHPDRYNWMAYAVQYDWPIDELGNVIQHESGGDLCAINPTSGATCWIQQHPGGAQFLDPATCMAQGYSKWVGGGRSFYSAWYAWW